MVQGSGQHLTDVVYWDSIWAGRDVPDSLDPNAPGLNGTVSRSLHRQFTRMFSRIGMRAGMSIVEVGCGGSTLLPYFVQEFGLRAEGIENAPNGIQLSLAIAQKTGIETPIHAADLFDLPGVLRNRFDVVFSSGLVEHFRPTTVALDALGQLARPGGYLVTLIPNLHGILGFVQKHIDREVYDLHVPLSAFQLAEAHRAAGLDIIDSGYFMTVNFGILNLGGRHSANSRRICERLTSWASKSVWLLEAMGLPEIGNAITSPYAFTIARTQI